MYIEELVHDSDDGSFLRLHRFRKLARQPDMTVGIAFVALFVLQIGWSMTVTSFVAQLVSFGAWTLLALLGVALDTPFTRWTAVVISGSEALLCIGGIWGNLAMLSLQNSASHDMLGADFGATPEFIATAVMWLIGAGGYGYLTVRLTRYTNAAATRR